MELVTEEPWVTDLLPPLDKVKLKAVGAVTLTVVDWLAVPPVPVQVNVYIVVAVGETVCDPEVAFVPDHAPDAVQTVALAEDQERVEALPEVTEVGLAEIETVGVADVMYLIK
ncbi:hypothetical protein A2197_02860 [Candidatus Woesebacteria bacterium RIFOXYA1_FULL_48_16]|uniref:Uncharacterized protein n=1 Tax=Candidatus Woesebacteria bacterium RIFOXYA1_FULL_48_16 TaxID=1802535 RepID=A0A1F8CQJ0_9BACT|nr:MAG: hypothetical protein A2197_02860 [Candidatus Woesebacteria bacterium RIFOXYA1_FULL_48_16]